MSEIKKENKRMVVKKTAKQVVKTTRGLSVPVITLKGEETGSLSAPKVLTETKINKSLLAQAIRFYLVNQRRGTASTKTRSEVAGGGKKPWKEKGTGRARQGSIRAPHWRGGGIVFGPKPRDFSLSLPKAMTKLALQHVWALVLSQKKLVVVENLSGISGKSKEIARLTEKLGRTLMIDVVKQEKVTRAVRNIENINFKIMSHVNVYDLLKHQKVLLTKSAFLKLSKEEKTEEK